MASRMRTPADLAMLFVLNDAVLLVVALRRIVNICVALLLSAKLQYHVCL
jgi:hypothetical protein